MATVRAIQFIYRHVLLSQKLRHHTDGKRLSVAPNNKTISYSVFISLICGRLQNNHQYGHTEGHIDRHQNRDSYPGKIKKPYGDTIHNILRNIYIHRAPLSAILRSSGGSISNEGFRRLFLNPVAKHRVTACTGAI